MIKRLNLSGHFNSKLEELGFEFPGIIQLNLEKSIEDNLKELTNFLKEQEINSDTIITIALPGMSLLATLVITAIHGLTGNFPMIVTLIRDDTTGEYKIDKVCDLQIQRNEICRSLRKDIIAL